MPEAQDAGLSRAPAEPRGRRTRRHRRRPGLLRYVWVIPAVALVVAAPWIWNWLTLPHFLKQEPLPGYITDSSKLEMEYRLFTGKSLEDVTTSQQFEQATDLMLAGNYTDAVLLLEAVSKQAAVPLVFNNLGVLYMKLKDGAHGVQAFRDALARDHDYQPVRANLKALNVGDAADPRGTELEPNNTNREANVVWVDRPIQATITASVGDVDCFWFTTPRPPRDRIAIQIINQSITLNPRLRMYDASGKVLSGFKEAPNVGGSVRVDFSPPPNTLYYLQVEGADGTGGAYTLSVSSLRAYDVYEPNDDIMNATRLVLGQPIDANIMDANDTDFFSFTSPVGGSVTIDITNHGTTLIPGLSTFGPDLRHLGFGPDVDQPGGSLHHAMTVEANQTYYIQVWAKSDTAGYYSLTIK